MITCVFLFVVLMTKSDQKNSSQVSSEVHIKLERDSILGANKRLDAKCKFLEAKCAQLQKSAYSINQNIQELKQKEHEKISAMDSTSNTGLFRFFSNVSTKGAY